WADSAAEEPAVGGLSLFGREVVRECNRLGVIADLSHVATATMHSTLDISTAPAFFSHSSARALCDHPRNVPDEVLARARDSNGIVMVTFVPGFLTSGCRDWFRQLMTYTRNELAEYIEDSPEWIAGRATWIADNPCPPCGVADVADHVEHIREVAGLEHVGLGGDFDGVVVLPTGLSGVDGYPALLDELASRHWSDSHLANLTCRN